MLKKLTFAQVMEKINDGFVVHYQDVQARALKRRIWVYGHGQSGCLFDSGPYYATTKEQACNGLLEMLAEDDCKGAVTALKRNHVFYNSYGVATISSDTLGSIL